MKLMSVLVLAMSAGISSCYGQKADQPQAIIGLLTYNIRYLNQSDGLDIWANRREAVANTVRRFDIVGLQEVVVEQFRNLQTDVAELDWYGVGRDDGAEKGEMVAIGWRKTLFEPLSRGTFWLSKTPQEKGSIGWDAALPRIASWIELLDKRTQQKLLVVNTHFDHVGEQARTNSAKLIADWLSTKRGDMPAVLLGDLNSEVNSAPLKELLQAGGQGSLRNAREVSLVPDSGPDTTWNGFRELQIGRRIDFILVAGDLQVDTLETLNPKTRTNRFASDHLPVSAQIQILSTR